MQFNTLKRHPQIARIAAVAYACAVPLLIAAGLLAGAEWALRVGGYGFPTPRFIQDTSVSPSVWRGNQAFVRRFFPGPWYPDIAPVQLTTPAPANALRVAVLGESAAYGFPDPAFGFARMFQVLLERQYPDRTIELINAAENGVTSPILLEQLPQVLAMKPDLLILYIGNNEFIGPFGPSNSGASGDMSPLRIRAQILASRLRLSQPEIYLGRHTTPGATPPPPGRLLANNDPAVHHTYDRYEANLRAMLDLAADAAVPVVLCTVAVNERDWAPFADSHRAGISPPDLNAWNTAWDEGKAAWDNGDAEAAVAAWKRAEAIDPEPATLAYSLAQAYKATGNAPAAAEAFTRALTQDALRYRTTPAMNDRVRQLATEYAQQHVVLADCDAQLRNAIAADTTNTPYFYEHCHLAPAGNYAIATCIHAAAAEFLPTATPPVFTLTELEHRLGWTPWHARESLRTVYKLIAKAPYMNRLDYPTWADHLNATVASLDPASTPATLAPLRTEIEAQYLQHPDDPFLARNLAQLQKACDDIPAAATTLETLVAQYPHYDAAWELLAQTRTLARHHREAATAWRAAYALRTDRSDWRASLGEALFADEQYPASRTEWQALLAENPASEQSWWRFGQCYDREKNYPAAIATYREALTHLPNNAGFYYYLAKSLNANQEPDAARAAIEAGLRIAPDHAPLNTLATELAAKSN